MPIFDENADFLCITLIWRAEEPNGIDYLDGIQAEDLTIFEKLPKETFGIQILDSDVFHDRELEEAGVAKTMKLMELCSLKKVDDCHWQISKPKGKASPFTNFLVLLKTIGRDVKKIDSCHMADATRVLAQCSEDGQTNVLYLCRYLIIAAVTLSDEQKIYLPEFRFLGGEIKTI